MGLAVKVAVAVAGTTVVVLRFAVFVEPSLNVAVAVIVTDPPVITEALTLADVLAALAGSKVIALLELVHTQLNTVTPVGRLLALAERVTGVPFVMEVKLDGLIETVAWGAV